MHSSSIVDSSVVKACTLIARILLHTGMADEEKDVQHAKSQLNTPRLPALQVQTVMKCLCRHTLSTHTLSTSIRWPSLNENCFSSERKKGTCYFRFVVRCT